MSDVPGAWSLRSCTVDLTAIRSNARLLRELTSTDHLIAVVKANAYGHGAVAVAEAVLDAGAAQLGVTSVQEALELRRAGIDAPILSWQHDVTTDFSAALAARLELGVGTVGQLHRVLDVARARGETAVVHLKVETGLARNGVMPGDWDEYFALASRAQSEGALEVRGLWSHLANAGEGTDAAAGERLREAVGHARRRGLRPELLHLASSAAALTRPGLAFDAVRCGIALYGLQPEDYVDTRSMGFRPAMTLRARVVATRRVPAGTGVSYGHQGRTSRPTTLALIAAGYADGVPRAASGSASVWIDGSRHPIVGRVAMDQLVVDVGDRDVHEGDVAVLFGDPERGHPSPDDFADACGTIGYEIVTRLGARVAHAPH